MSNKQNNDDSEKLSSVEQIGKPNKRGADPALTQKLKQVNYAESMTFKQAMQVDKKKTPPKIPQPQKIQLKGSAMSSTLRQQVSTTLPITIHELQEKTLNQYLKQFMQISAFQSIQKGKQLMDLVKQSPNSKQSLWVVNKLFKLFKSTLPEAVLCSFQFLRELIEIGNDKIPDLIEENLLMQLVEIIEYRSYIQNMDRGNTYFLSQFFRYVPDEKVNHLLRIGSTFFKMVHEALYVWGTFFFPNSGFNKMLNKLVNINKIKFPQYPTDFKFYSQARINLFLALKEKNQKIKQMSIRDSKQIQKNTLSQSKSSQKLQPKSLEKVQQQSKGKQIENHQHTNQINFSKNLTKNEKQDINRSSENIPIQKKQSPTLQTLPKKQIEQPIFHQDSKKKIEQQEFQCIQLTKKPIKQKINKDTELKLLDEFKKIKPSKFKQKKQKLSSFLVAKQNKQNITSQKTIDFSNLQNILDPLNLISSNQSKQETIITDEKPLIVEQVPNNTKKQSIPKEMLKIDLKKINSHNLKPAQQVKKQLKNVKELKDSEQTEQHTFRPNQQKNIFQIEKSDHQFSTSRQNQTVKIQETERQRFSYSITEESQERIKKFINKDKSNPNSDRIPENSLVVEFLKKQFQNLKNSIVHQIKQDIITNLKQIQIQKCVQSQVSHQVFKKNQQIIKENLNNTTEDHQYKIKNQPKKSSFTEKSKHDNYKDQKQPSAQAFQFIKRKMNVGKKLRAVSKRKRTKTLNDLQIDHEENDENQNFNVSSIKEQKTKQKVQQKKFIDEGVNTEGLKYENLYEQISSLKQKLDFLTERKQNQLKNQDYSKKSSDYLGQSYHQKELINKTPFTRNKNQEENLKQSSFSSLRTTSNSVRKRSKSKLSQRRSSIESMVIERAFLKNQNNHQELQQIFGGPKTLLFNAAINSVKKKRASAVFF